MTPGEHAPVEEIQLPDLMKRLRVSASIVGAACSIAMITAVTMDMIVST